MTHRGYGIDSHVNALRETARAEIIPTESESAPEVVCIQLSGDWLTGRDRADVDGVLAHLSRRSTGQTLAFDTSNLGDWDSSLLTFLLKLPSYSDGATLDPSGLPLGVQRLLDLATAIPARTDTRSKTVRPRVLDRIGDSSLEMVWSSRDVLDFTGDIALQFGRFLTGRARFRQRDFWVLIEECGVHAVPIVSLISFLVGLILAFIGAVQLATFGAQIYVADLVGIAMTRELGAVMAAIIMTGRTGAAFAAQLGTMQVNEEIDALRTLAISPTEFLVLPRILALTLMMPLLCLYADLMGILGGLVVGVGVLGLSASEYLHQTVIAVDLTQISIGLVHGFVFGVLVSFSGCLRGMQCGRSSAAVGAATTSAVVTGIVCVTVATAILTAICNVLGI